MIVFELITWGEKETAFIPSWHSPTFHTNYTFQLICYTYIKVDVCF